MRLRQQDNITDLDVKIQVIAQEILGLDRALADGIDVARHWLRFRQFHVLRPHRYDHLSVLVDALARMRLDLAYRRTHDTAPVAERGDRPSDEIGAADEVGDEPVARLLVNLARRADLDDSALVHHRDLVRKRERLGLIVGHIYRREIEIALQPLELRSHAVAQLGIEIRERLIQQQKLWLHHQGACEREALLLASRKLGGIAICQLFERYGVQYSHYPVADILLAQLPYLEREGGVLKYVHVRPDGVGLEHHAEIAPVGCNEDALLRRIDQPTIGFDLAGSRLLQPRNRAQRRGLAAPRGSEQREQLTLRHLERDVLHGFDGAAPFVGIFGKKGPHAEHAAPVPCFTFRHFRTVCLRAAPARRVGTARGSASPRAPKAPHIAHSATTPRS